MNQINNYTHFYFTLMQSSNHFGVYFLHILLTVFESAVLIKRCYYN